jgi:RNA polymerase sigma-70 factor (ECF subfamily)
VSHPPQIRAQPAKIAATNGAALFTVKAVNIPFLSAVRAPDDLSLAQRCVAGERAAQRELFDRERRRVHAALFRILGSNTMMDDLVQESFLEIFRSLKGFRGEASLGTWVDRCTVRVAYAFLTRKKPRAAQLELVPEIASDDPSAEQRVLAREAARRLYAELDRIEPTHRLAFTLHAIDGRSLEEVAKIMEATVVATKARVWRARQALEKRARRDPVLAGFMSGEMDGSEEGAR